MKKIGIVDYYIDEWHSNVYLDLFKRANEELGLDCKICYGYAELDRFENRLSTSEWCDKNSIEKCDTIEELCEKSDYILILSPANPEKHLGYAETVLKYKKNTYIDKTFAPDLTTAKAIYALGEKYGTKFFSTSALRYAEELDEFVGKNVESLSVTGNGRSLEEYVIHQIEMAVKIMQKGATSLRVFHRKTQSSVIIDFDGGRTCTLSFAYSGLPFSIDVQLGGEETSKYKKVGSDGYFYNLVKNILIFFDSDKVPFDKEQTLQTIAIRDAVIKGMAKSGKKITIKK